jgi:hypothetical protein
MNSSSDIPNNFASLTTCPQLRFVSPFAALLLRQYQLQYVGQFNFLFVITTSPSKSPPPHQDPATYLYHRGWRFLPLQFSLKYGA